MEFKKGLSYDDVLIIPKKAIVNSRREVDLKTKLTKKITLNIPLVSANMDTVTETQMAIELARNGGIGIIHQFMPIEEQKEMIKEVKRSQGLIIEDPLTIKPDCKLEEIKEKILTFQKAGLIVVDENKKVLGIVTMRDLVLEVDENKTAKELMTPKKDLIYAKPGITTEEAKKILKENKIEKLPIIKEDGTLYGLITSKDLQVHENIKNASLDKKKRLLVGAAVGVKDYHERIKALIEEEVDVIVVDVAHGHSVYALKAVEDIKKNYDIEVIAGNVATKEGTEELISKGADAIKVGIGPGAACTTRIVTGAGVPQITAIIDSYEIAKKYKVPIIADGGIKNSGDIVKAIIAGANTVMMGSMFAGTDEAPGKIIHKNGRMFKMYRGSSSSSMAEARALRQGKKVRKDISAEGITGYVPYKGKVSELITQILGGIRSGISYAGSNNLQSVIGQQNFIRMTFSGLKESKPHDIYEW